MDFLHKGPVICVVLPFLSYVIIDHAIMRPHIILLLGVELRCNFELKNTVAKSLKY